MDGSKSLQNLNAAQNLEEQLADAFSYPYSPNWQDASTQEQCDMFDQCLGDEFQLALNTGSKAHHVGDFRLLLTVQADAGSALHWPSNPSF